ncbi:MAG: hypothetical protein NT118_00890, partial [Lentisphaerae bacterium]|nr:hypothetical protein [Lentisphaerota bacterium]
VLHPEKLPHPLGRPVAATRWAGRAAPAIAPDQPAGSKLDVGQLIGEGIHLTLPGDDAVLIQVR